MELYQRNRIHTCVLYCGDVGNNKATSIYCIRPVFAMAVNIGFFSSSIWVELFNYFFLFLKYCEER